MNEKNIYISDELVKLGYSEEQLLQLAPIIRDTIKCTIAALNMPIVINWVAIDEKLPKEHEDVLVYYYFNRASRHFPDNQFMMQTSFYDGKFECKEEVTHWAALPEPPCL